MSVGNYKNAKPFLIPFEHSDAVKLDFNYWMRAKQIDSGGTFSSLVLSLILTGDCPQFDSRSSQSINDNITSNVIMIVAQGVDQSILTGQLLDSLPFLSICSSIPIIQQVCDDISDVKGETESMALLGKKGYPSPDSLYNTFLWHPTPPISEDDTKRILSRDLFLKYCLNFQVI